MVAVLVAVDPKKSHFQASTDATAGAFSILKTFPPNTSSSAAFVPRSECRYSGLLSDPSSIVNDPGYQLALQQGTNAMDASAAARGTLMSGGQMGALQQFGQNLASNQYNQALSRYNTAIGVGQNALSLSDQSALAAAQGQGNTSNSLANLAFQVGQGQSNDMTNQGNLYMNNAGQVGNMTTALAQLQAQLGNAQAGNLLSIGGMNNGLASNALNLQATATANQGNALSQALGGVGSTINSGINNYLGLNTLQNLLGGLGSGSGGGNWQPVGDFFG